MMKKNKIRLFAFEIAVSLALLCAPGVWAQQSSGVLPQAAPPSSPPTGKISSSPQKTTGTMSAAPVAMAPASAADPNAASAAQADTASKPDWVIYRFYFMNVTDLEQAAEHEEKEKHDGSKSSPWRTHEQRAAGLTDDQAKAVKEIAQDCESALKAQDEKLAAFRDAYHQQHPGVTQPPPEFNQLWEERIQIINQHIAQLRSFLGDYDFGKFDSYVKREFAPDIKTVAAPTTTPKRVQDSTDGGAR